MKHAWLLVTLGACAHAQVPAPSVATEAAHAKPVPQASATSPAAQELAAYCDAASKRRAAFRLDRKIEVRGASLSPRPGYTSRALTTEEQSIAGQSLIYLAPDSAVTAAELAGGELRPDSEASGYDVSVRVKSPSALQPRLKPLVGGSIAVLVDGRLISLPRLLAPTVAAVPVAYGLALPAARDTAARLGPAVDETALLHLEERCLNGEGTLCLQLGEERLFGRDAPYDAEHALPLFEAGCRSGIGAACQRAAKLATSPERAAQLLDDGCRLNDPDACLQTAARFLSAPRKPDAVTRGRAILKQSCDRGAGSACMALVDDRGRDFRGAAAPPLETQRELLGLIERGCTGGDAEACFARANAARQGLLGSSTDAGAAKQWLRTGCKLDPSGGSLALEARLGGGNPALLTDIKEAGCTGEWPARAPYAPLCSSGLPER